MSSQNTTSAQVTVVGSVNRDTIVQVPRFPAPGETLEGSGTRSGLGGKGANQAVAAARAGAPTAWIGAVGHDGADVLDALRADGIDVSGALWVEDALTGTAWIMVDAAAENLIVIDPGANQHLRPEHVPERIEGVVLLQHEVSPSVIARAIETSREAVTVLNPAPFRPVPPHLLEGIDVLVLNEIELAEITGTVGELSELTDVRAALESLTGNAIIATLGSRGAMVRRRSKVEHVEAPKVSTVDTTGAGDTFCGAFAAELARGRYTVDAVEFAVHAAALSVTRSGAQESIPRREQILGLQRSSSVSAALAPPGP